MKVYFIKQFVLSEKNIKTLNDGDIKAIRIYPQSGRKAYKAERAIRTVFLFLI